MNLALLDQTIQTILKGKESRPTASELVETLLNLEKTARYEKPSHTFMELLGTWQLSFITGTKKARNRAGIVLGSGWYLPRWLKIEIGFQATGEDRGNVNNTVNFGALHLVVTGPAKFLPKKNLLAFDFTHLQIKVMGLRLYEGDLRGGKATTESFFDTNINQQAFFAFFVITKTLLAARGRGGGLAVWGKVTRDNE